MAFTGTGPNFFFSVKRWLCPRTFGALLAASALAAGLVAPGAARAQSSEGSGGTTYYLDSTVGMTDGDGLSEGHAFDSLDDVNALTFQPGDTLLIKRGTSYQGTLWPKGSGEPGHPIVIDVYGTGEKPLIDAAGAAFTPQRANWQGPFTGADGQQIGAAVYLYNQSWVEVNNLHATNSGRDADADRSGIRVEGYDAGTLEHVYVRGCMVSDVRGFNGQDDIYSVIPTNPDGSPMDGFTDEDGQNPNTTNTFWGARTTHRTGGINFVTYTARHPEKPNHFNVPVQELDKSKKVTTFHDVLIEGNTIENCQANGITLTNVKGTLDDRAFRHTDVVIRDNTIHNVTRSGIVPLYTSGVLVEWNKVDTFQSTPAGYGCGIWCDRANDMVFRHNEVCHGQNSNDGMAFNLDDMTENGRIEYNYTHDNFGGGVMLHVRTNSYNRNHTVRFNLSVNDSGQFADHNAQIVAVGENNKAKIEKAAVYNNTFISNKVCHPVFQGNEVRYTNNIWMFTNPAMTSKDNAFAPGGKSVFDNNLYCGVKAPSSDTHAIKADPHFVGGSKLFGLNRDAAYAACQPQEGSPVIGAALPVDSDGGRDILGNMLSKPGNLGAFAGLGHKVASAVPEEILANDARVSMWLADGARQDEAVQETPAQADTKWVSTTHEGKPVLYTKAMGASILVPFTGTGATVRLKTGPGAGRIQLQVYRGFGSDTPPAGDAVAEKVVNTKTETAGFMDVDAFDSLSSAPEDYVLKVVCNEGGRACNFASLTVRDAHAGSSSCDRDGVASVQLEQPAGVLAVADGESLRIPLTAHVLLNTCVVPQDPVSAAFSVTGDGARIEDGKLVVERPGSYVLSASASWGASSAKDAKTVTVGAASSASEHPDFVNRRSLEALVYELDTLERDRFAPSSFAALDEAIVRAKKLLERSDASQQELDALVAELRELRSTLIQIDFDAEDDRVEKQGGWALIKDKTLRDGAALKSAAAGETLSLPYEGTGVKVYGRRAPGVGIMEFTVYAVDGSGVETELVRERVDGYAEEKQDESLLFEFDASEKAENGRYRVRVLNTGEKHPGAENRDANAIIDYITIGRAADPVFVHTISTRAGQGGTITPSGAVQVEDGKDQVFSIAPDEGYKIADVTVDGASRGALSVLKLEAVTSDHEVVATFARTEEPTDPIDPPAPPHAGGDKGNRPSGPSADGGKGQMPSGLPATGDSSQIVVCLAGAVASLAAAWALFRRARS